mmetsp:Transcript_44863/g.84226  ORF Transcript_44863/g.84226 Transcript_44863/m.84226 type:complete len:162 (-) Transcript_44863:805-1290(-)
MEVASITWPYKPPMAPMADTCPPLGTTTTSPYKISKSRRSAMDPSGISSMRLSDVDLTGSLTCLRTAGPSEKSTLQVGLCGSLIDTGLRTAVPSDVDLEEGSAGCDFRGMLPVRGSAGTGKEVVLRAALELGGGLRLRDTVRGLSPACEFCGGLSKLGRDK